jgi:membrane-associated phospholipid phosphatase
LADEKTETILHKFLPSSSFPSDHAALSMAIAMGTLVW